MKLPVPCSGVPLFLYGNVFVNDGDSPLSSNTGTWLESTRPVVYWMTGFSNPQGFLTAMRQEVTRRHKADKWALDEMVFHNEVCVCVCDADTPTTRVL